MKELLFLVVICLMFTCTKLHPCPSVQCPECLPPTISYPRSSQARCIEIVLHTCQLVERCRPKSPGDDGSIMIECMTSGFPFCAEVSSIGEEDEGILFDLCIPAIDNTLCQDIDREFPQSCKTLLE